MLAASYIKDEDTTAKFKIKDRSVDPAKTGYVDDYFNATKITEYPPTILYTCGGGSDSIETNM